MKDVLLDIQNLSVAFKYERKFMPVTHDVSFQVYRGEILGLVGESGSGKSVTSKVVMGLLPRSTSRIVSGKAVLEGKDVPPLPSLAERCDTAVRQFRLAAEAKGERVAVLEARRHYCWYLKGVSHSGYYKEQIVQMNTLEDVDRVTKGIKRDLI